MGVPAGYYERLAQAWRAQGVSVTQVSLSTDRPTRASRDGYAAFVEERIPEAHRRACETSPGSTVVTVGHSLGGQLGLISASRCFPDAPVVLVASGTADHRAFAPPRRQFYLAGSQAIGALATILGRWPGDRLGFGGSQSAATMRDWASNVRTGKYRSRGRSFDYDASLADYRGPLLAIDVTGDLLAPPTARGRLLSKTPSARVDTSTYAPTRGSARPGAHFTWARDLPGVVPEIDAWIARLQDH